MRAGKVRLLIPILLLASTTLFAGQAEIVDVKVTANQGSYRFDVTLRHEDTGWEHYADGWEVLSPAGDSLGKRVLAHPHVSEQPFTRSLSGVKIPEGIGTVSIRAHDSVHGYNPKQQLVKLPNR